MLCLFEKNEPILAQLHEFRRVRPASRGISFFFHKIRVIEQDVCSGLSIESAILNGPKPGISQRVAWTKSKIVWSHVVELVTGSSEQHLFFFKSLALARNDSLKNHRNRAVSFRFAVHLMMLIGPDRKVP